MRSTTTEKTYAKNDLVLPILAERGELTSEAGDCRVKVVVSDQDVRLFIGPRDWQWDPESRRFIGAGTRVHSGGGWAEGEA